MSKLSETIKPKSVEIDFNPLWDYCLLEPVIPTQTPGGLAIPDGAKTDDTMKSLVIKAGPGAYRDNGTFVPNPIKEGDYVYHLAWNKPFKLVLNGKQYIVLSGRDCVATTIRKE